MKTLKLFCLVVLCGVMCVNLTACSDNEETSFISTSVQDIELQGADEKTTFTITCTQEWRVIEDDLPNWITVSPMSGDSGTHTITVEALGNNRKRDRGCSINFVCNDGSTISYISITQKSTPQWEDYPVRMNDDTDWIGRTKLIMVGDIDGMCIRKIRHLCGTDEYDGEISYNYDSTLKILDLKDANIISGGAFYCCLSHNEENGYVPTFFTSTDKEYIDYSIRSVIFGPGAFEKRCIDYYRPGINEYMFRGCATLQKITLPKSARDIWLNAFVGCESLKEIHLLASVPPMLKIGENQSYDKNYYDCFTKSTLYIPKGTIELYKKADGWKEFDNIVEE